MPKLLVIIATLLLSVNVWGQELDKSQSLTIEKDSVTSRWTATCDASVSGVDPHKIYSGRFIIDGGVGSVINAAWQVEPTPPVEPPFFGADHQAILRSGLFD